MTTLKKVLVIVDMQAYYPAARDVETRQYVMEEILDAKKNGDYIIVLEYEGCGPSYREIIEEVIPYKNGIILRKGETDGSPQIIAALNSFNIEPFHFLIAGVNADCCVCDTVMGLHNRMDNVPDLRIEVVKEACNSTTKNSQQLKWVNRLASKQVVIVERKTKNWKQYAYSGRK